MSVTFNRHGSVKLTIPLFVWACLDLSIKRFLFAHLIDSETVQADVITLWIPETAYDQMHGEAAAAAAVPPHELYLFWRNVNRQTKAKIRGDQPAPLPAPKGGA